MYTIMLIPFVIAIFLAINMGASGTSPSFSASYGANMLRKEIIPALFGTFVLLGAVIAGAKVVKTVGGEILPSSEMSTAMVSIILLSSALSLFFANILKVPQSTSQCTVLALVGSAAYLKVLKTPKLLLEIVPIWLILPLVSFVITYLFGRCFYTLLKAKDSFSFAAIMDHPVWRWVTIGCSCYVAFSIGSNNVANAAGPIASMMVNKLRLDEQAPQVLLITTVSTLLVAPWFGIGSSILGRRVIETTGKEIIAIGPQSAALIACITASLLLLASMTRGIPTSLVQLNTAAILAIGMIKKGPRKILSKPSMMRIFIIWMVAPFISFCLALLLTACASKLGLL